MKTLIISTGFADLELRDGKLWNVMRFCHADVGSDQNRSRSRSPTRRPERSCPSPRRSGHRGDGKLRVVRPATPTADRHPPEGPGQRGLADQSQGSPDLRRRRRRPSRGDLEREGHRRAARRDLPGPHARSSLTTSPKRPRTVSWDRSTDRSEQLILGANNPIFLVEAQWKQIADPKRNPVIWQRVDADWDCARLASERAKIFPPCPKSTGELWPPLLIDPFCSATPSSPPRVI